MLRYVPAEVTARAKEIAEEMLKGTIQIDATFGEVAARVVDKTSIDTSCRTKVPTKECILFGETEIRLGAVEQLVEAVRKQCHYRSGSHFSLLKTRRLAKTGSGQMEWKEMLNERAVNRRGRRVLSATRSLGCRKHSSMADEHSHRPSTLWKRRSTRRRAAAAAAAAEEREALVADWTA